MKNQKERNLSLLNINCIIEDYLNSLKTFGETIQGKYGLALLHAVKRDKLDDGPYPGVTFFEASNRIMSDLVILYGVEYLLRNSIFPFTEYAVELGNENKKYCDLKAISSNALLVGEAFNVAPSFFQGKKTHALKKLNTNFNEAKYRLLMFNSDAIDASYKPRYNNSTYYVIVNIASKNVMVVQ
jgi:hypothetical protein